MRTHGFGIMAELERDIVYQNIFVQKIDGSKNGDQKIDTRKNRSMLPIKYRNAGANFPGKPKP